MARPVPASWSHCSTANDTKEKTSLTMTVNQPLNIPNSDQGVSSDHQAVDPSCWRYFWTFIECRDTGDGTQKKMKLLFSAPNTADSCSCQPRAMLPLSEHLFTRHLEKEWIQMFCWFIYMVMWSCGTLWRHKQQRVGLSNPADWHLCIDFYSNLLRPYLDFRGLVRSRAKRQHKIHQQYKSLQVDE